MREVKMSRKKKIKCRCGAVFKPKNKKQKLCQTCGWSRVIHYDELQPGGE